MTPYQKALPALFAILTASLATSALAANEDYESQRMAFAASAGYSAYGLTTGEISTSMKARALWNKGERDQAISLLNDWIQKYPLSIAGHRMLSEFFRTLSTNADAADDRTRLEAEHKAHFEKYAGLIKSIAHNTQCASAEDKCKVINIAEENAIIVDTGGTAKVRQSVARPQGVPYDVIVVRNSAGEERTFYFDISVFYMKGL
jgi:hypothetical protein